MTNYITKISKSAKKFIQKREIMDVTFVLIDNGVTGCCIGVKAIEPVYKAPKDASGYLYCKFENCHIFISRRIKIIGPLVLTTEGLVYKRLALDGASIPL